ncbi:MAG: TetR/AcrR family transcriptional regulator [Candidatus Marinimicrobia bacterium]|nr:TetR/AcrR family transcriptional regulator [Candidatus Neomarinimicrobiota bacterium]
MLLVASSIFYRHGIEQRSMKHIAEAVGMGRSSMYSYFRSREDILHFALAYAIREFASIKKGLMASPDPVAEKIYRFFAASIYENPNIKRSVTVVI